jgi:hypothetical protein
VRQSAACEHAAAVAVRHLLPVRAESCRWVFLSRERRQSWPAFARDRGAVISKRPRITASLIQRQLPERRRQHRSQIGACARCGSRRMAWGRRRSPIQRNVGPRHQGAHVEVATRLACGGGDRGTDWGWRSLHRRRGPRSAHRSQLALRTSNPPAGPIWRIAG